jgi:anaerobic selenocysteine-containing dehydrogenase
MSLDKLKALYDEFPWIEMSQVMVPIIDSNDNWRYVTARRKLVVGAQYIYRLKQFAEEKFSAVSLASTNIRSENTKSKANKLHKTVHAATPVRFGEMEFENLMHSRVEDIIQVIMFIPVNKCCLLFSF